MQRKMGKVCNLCCPHQHLNWDSNVQKHPYSHELSACGKVTLLGSNKITKDQVLL